MRVLVVGGDRSVCEMFQEAKHTVTHLDPDVICFTGGADLTPAMYKQKNEGLSICDHKRDIYEMDVYRAQFRRHPDVLFVGICRGGQFLNVMNGGSMKQHIEGHSAGVHNVLIGGKLHLLHEDHHQGMVPTEFADVIGVDARDSNPEILWYSEARALCFQAHPEWGHEPTRRLFMDMVEERYEVRNPRLARRV